MKTVTKKFVVGWAILLVVMSIAAPVAAATDRGDVLVEVDVSKGTEVYITLNGMRHWVYNGTSQCFSDAIPAGPIIVQPMVYFGTTAAVSLHRVLKECTGTVTLVAGATGTLCTGSFEYSIESNPPKKELVDGFKSTYRVEQATCRGKPALKLIIQ